MNTLDDLKTIRNLDKSNLLSSIQQLYLQIEQTQHDLSLIHLPNSYKNINCIVVNGMGGSRLGARVAERLFEDTLSIPIIPRGNYELPNFVNDKTLIILSSYSGNTEEILASFKIAQEKKAKILIFAESGKLAAWAKEKKIPGYYNFTPQYNPCNQPRMSLGYQVLGMMLLLSKCGLIKIRNEEINNLTSYLKYLVTKFDVTIATRKNLTKQLAQKLFQKIPILVGSEFLVGSLHAWRNQLNENAKQIAVYYEIPELNHHLLEGMQFPKNNSNNLLFIFVESSLYHQRNQRRYLVTKKVLEANKIPYCSIKLEGKTKLLQAFEIIQIGSFITYYLTILNNLDPSPIPWVDFFKKELEKLK